MTFSVHQLEALPGLSLRARGPGIYHGYYEHDPGYPGKMVNVRLGHVINIEKSYSACHEYETVDYVQRKNLEALMEIKPITFYYDTLEFS